MARRKTNIRKLRHGVPEWVSFSRSFGTLQSCAMFASFCYTRCALYNGKLQRKTVLWVFHSTHILSVTGTTSVVDIVSLCIRTQFLLHLDPLSVLSVLRNYDILAPGRGSFSNTAISLEPVKTPRQLYEPWLFRIFLRWRCI